MTSIGEFISIIDETIHQYNISGLIFPDPAELGKHKGLHSQLMEMKERFKRQKDRATTIRDGLSLNICSIYTSLPLIFHDKSFNASAMVESHLSTRLAQNVKLLTYVSIFYLLLGFYVVALPT
jgi:hypothetical protein